MQPIEVFLIALVLFTSFIRYECLSVKTQQYVRNVHLIDFIDDGPDGKYSVADVIAQKSIKNMVQYGFNLGTHTVHHKDLSQLSVRR